MISNISERLSLLKIAGIKEFITLEYYGQEVRVCLISSTESSLRIFPDNSLSHYKVAGTISIDLLSESLFETLGKFVKDNSLENIHVICDIDQYRVKTLRVSKDVESFEEWFEENSRSVLPDASLGEFSFSYQVINEDEDYNYLLVSVSRTDLIKRISEGIENTGLIPLIIAPFSLYGHDYKRDDESSQLSVQYRSGFLQYSFLDKSMNLLSGGFPVQEDIAFSEALTYSLNLVKQNIGYTTGQQISIKVSCKTIDKREVKECIQEVFRSEGTFPELEDRYLHYYLPHLAVHSSIKNYGKSTNLIEEENQSKKREAIEKSSVTRVTLILGLALFFILILITGGEMLLTDSIKETNDVLVNYEAKSNIIETKSKENKKLKSDFRSLAKLKSGEVVMPEIMEVVSRAIGEDCYLSNLNIIKESESEVKAEINGVAKSSGEVSDIVSNLEYNKNIDKVSLVFSNLVSDKKVKYNPGLQGSEFNNFKIIFYYGLQKQ